MNRILIGIFWIVLYILLAAGAALIMMAIQPLPPRRDFWTELSVALGFMGMAQVLIQFLLVARFKSITAPYGIDIILYYHRQIGAIALLAILAHPAILIIRNPALAELLNPFGGTTASRWGLLAAGMLIPVVALSWFRRKLRLGYEVWRIGHLALSLLAVAAALTHIGAVGHYVNTPAKMLGWVIFAGLLIAPLAQQRLLKPLWMLRRPWRVVDVRPEGGHTWSLALEPVGHEGLVFEPGQFVWVTLRSPFSIDEHPFSLSSSAEQPRRIALGIKEVGDFTSAVAQVQPGTLAYLDGPHGAFSIDRIPSAGYVFIAGGVGIVPFMSMIRTMHERCDRRSILLIYACRTADDLVWREELDRLARENKHLLLQVVYVLEEPPPQWTGETGRVDLALLRRVLPDERIARDYLICGPDAMIVKVERALLSLGIPAHRLHTERFDLV